MKLIKQFFRIILLFIIGTNTLFAQNDTAAFNPNVVQKPTIGIHIMPLSIIGPQPRLRIGGLVQKGRFEYVVDLEYGGRWAVNIFDKSDEKYRFYGIKPEFRYWIVEYSADKNGDDGMYLGLELVANTFTRELGRDEYEEAGMRYQFDSADQRRNLIGLIFKLGRRAPLLDPNLYIDYYVGFGFGQQYVDYSNEVNKRITLEEPTEEWFSSSDNWAAGKDGKVLIALGLKFGYQF